MTAAEEEEGTSAWTAVVSPALLLRGVKSRLSCRQHLRHRLADDVTQQHHGDEITIQLRVLLSVALQTT